MTLATEPTKPRYRVKAGSRPSEQQNSSANSSRQTDKADADSSPASATPFQRKPLRPHCLNPGLCAGSGRDHCWSCRKQMGSRADGGVDITMTHLNIAGAA